MTKINIGDRYANRAQCPVQPVHGIPAWISFTEVSAIPLLYAPALYGLHNVANLREGQV